MNSPTCDVLIIGAGPAGASLALSLCQNGLDVILAEKKSIIDHPVRCAELVTRNAASLFDFRIKGIDGHIDSMETYIGFIKEASSSAPGFMLNRKIFTSDLAARFVEEGGRLYKSSSFGSVSCRKSRGLSSILWQRQGPLEVRSKIVVGADGAASRVREGLAGREDRFMVAYQENIAIKAVPHKARVFFSPSIPGGYGWLFPKKSSINLGIGISKAAKADLRQAYSDFKRALIVKGFINGAEGAKKKAVSGLIPAGGMVQPVVLGGLVLVGDAAGLCHPITGSGIYNALYSARLASFYITEAARGKTGRLGPIMDEYRDAFGRSLNTALKKRELLDEEAKKGISSPDFNKLVKKTWIAFKQYWH